jgi:hypothetical protein
MSVYNVNQGGTGLTNLTSNAVLYGNNSTTLANSNKTAPTGDFVGTTDVQTLTNKNLTNDTFNTSTSTSGITNPLIVQSGSNQITFQNNSTSSLEISSAVTNMNRVWTCGTQSNGGILFNPTVSPWTGYVGTNIYGNDTQTWPTTWTGTVINGTNVPITIYWTKRNRLVTLSFTIAFTNSTTASSTLAITTATNLPAKLRAVNSGGTTTSAAWSVTAITGGTNNVDLFLTYSTAGNLAIRSTTLGNPTFTASASVQIPVTVHFFGPV